MGVDSVESYLADNRTLPFQASHREALLELELCNQTSETILAQANLHLVASADLYCGDLASAKDHASISLELRRGILGPDHLDTCKAMLLLARCTQFCRLRSTLLEGWSEKDTEAAELFQQAMDSCYQSLGVADEMTMRCLVWFVELLTFRDVR